MAEPLDLDAIRERCAAYGHEQTRRTNRINVVTAANLAADVPALLAEVERLRDEMDGAGERHDWAVALAEFLDVPDDLDPYFGIDRVARSQVRFLDEGDAEVARLRAALADEQASHAKALSNFEEMAEVWHEQREQLAALLDRLAGTVARQAPVVEAARAFAAEAHKPEHAPFWSQPWAEMTALLAAVRSLGEGDG